MNLNSSFRKLILVFIDILSLYFSFLFCSNIFKINNNFLLYLSFYLLISVLVYFISNQYKSLIRYINSFEIYKISIRNFIVILVMFLFTKLNNISNISYFFYFYLWLTSTFFIGIVKSIIRDTINFLQKKKSLNQLNVAIYGVCREGVQISSIINQNHQYNLKFFIDENLDLKERYINGIPIINENEIKINRNIDYVFLTKTILKSNKVYEIVNSLTSKNYSVVKLPFLENIYEGKLNYNQIENINIEDLLGRKRVNPIDSLLVKDVNNKNICITGAGGSIGSELVNQFLSLRPKSILMIDQCEYNLYKISEKIKDSQTSIECHYFLGNITDKKFLTDVFENFQVDVIYHAAAYKHVPIVEENPLEGIKNNLSSTLNLCQITKNFEIDKFILISTDKAVRPTNVMGASKRAAELIIKAFAEINNHTEYAIVRFGNVLDSSGSVVPQFKKQISEGGPISLTHKDIERYFMTIPEAAQLVIQAGAMTEGSDTFLLDMGKPVKIYELAKAMITLSGLTHKTRNNPKGDIEIDIVGLRKGEKLYEELLIDDRSEKTIHPLIFKDVEKRIDYSKIIAKIEDINKNLENRNKSAVLKKLKELVTEWEPSNNQF